jgi:hypothetical protein
MLLDPLCNFGKVLVLLADVVLFTQVDKVDNWLGGKQEERVYDLDLGNSQQIYIKIRCVISEDIRINQEWTSLHVTPALLRESESWDYRAIALCHLLRDRYELRQNLTYLLG